jgi:aspartate 1-decarboxylase
MQREVLRGKIHRATVTEANLEYEGSLTVDRDLMDAAGLAPYERIDVYDVTNGSRFSTYLIEGARGSGVICVNGAAAHLARAGDRVIITGYGLATEAELKSHHPKVVLVDERNRIRQVLAESTGALVS